jgi:hypothetical protein
MIDALSLLFIMLIWVINFGISAYNAIMVGKIWYDDYNKGWTKVVTWSAAIMSACGFTWCYLILIAVAAGALNLISQTYVEGALYLGYLVVILPILGTGIVIWIHSLIVAWKQRDMISIGVAGWNTLAMGSNIWSAFRTIPEALKIVGGMMKGSGDARAKGFIIMIAIVVIAIASGILTTYSLIKWSSNTT